MVLRGSSVSIYTPNVNQMGGGKDAYQILFKSSAGIKISNMNWNEPNN
jgi:hypothetical protein